MESFFCCRSDLGDRAGRSHLAGLGLALPCQLAAQRQSSRGRKIGNVAFYSGHTARVDVAEAGVCAAHLQRTATPEIAILADGSDSMKTRDLFLSNNVMSRAQWLDQQLQRGFWEPLQNKAKVSVEYFAAPSTNQNAINGTDLGQALEDTFHRFKNLKAVLLLSDGDWNMGKSPLGVATRYREQNIPVFTVAVGRETPLPDLALENVSAPAYGLFGEEIAIPFKVTSHLPREVKTTVSIVDDFGGVSKKKSPFRPTAKWRTQFFGLRAPCGEVTATVKLPVEPDEGIAENNERTFQYSNT